MSTYYTNAVLMAASLSNTALTNPTIASGASTSVNYKDGEAASDSFVPITTATSPPAYLTPVIASGWAMALVTNPAGGADTTVYACVSTTYTPVGVLKAGMMMLVPLQVGTRLGASVAASTQTVGVTFTAATTDATD